MSDWPFDQPKNCGTIISRSILEGRNDILFVSHDEDDHGWQFLDNETFESRQAALVCLSEVVKIDPTVLDVSNLEPGWVATRAERGAPWVREQFQDISESE